MQQKRVDDEYDDDMRATVGLILGRRSYLPNRPDYYETGNKYKFSRRPTTDAKKLSVE